LTRLAALDSQQAKVVELRYCTGLGIDETARVLGISAATVKRDWTMARAWLRREPAATT
jgi:RNA polymerase sigma-70 factor (ECF subfamily)